MKLKGQTHVHIHTLWRQHNVELAINIQWVKKIVTNTANVPPLYFYRRLTPPQWK